ncbi:chalcone isomerase family protein [Roseateles amylovorans]|uniref:Chalcone isomerase family protein n=1 Tax=Roseateles amylovorans TaxID=2978473 RepID=A0ABY6B2F9_9BURK|nr:chalcone isomerase family protein [Roseateles amylovorans]UXH78894.1 chalcone isomerase family protein [Roseateles amylovorans]
MTKLHTILVPGWVSSLILAAVLGAPSAHAQTATSPPAPATSAAPPGAAPPIEVNGVKYDTVVEVAGQRLVLNGAGTRYKAIFKVYTAGLYLNAKAATPEAVLANTGPKRMHIQMLRDIDGEELGKLFTKGMEQNATREEFGRAINGVLRMSEIFVQKKKLVTGESFGVDYIPGTGTVIFVNGKVMPGDPIKEAEFFNTLLKIWLGKSPADSGLKTDLLGGRAATPSTRNAVGSGR